MKGIDTVFINSNDIGTGDVGEDIVELVVRKLQKLVRIQCLL